MASRRTIIQCAWPGCPTNVIVLKTAVVKSTAKGSAGFSYQVAGFNRTYYSRHPICEEHIRRLVNAFGGKVRVQYLFRLFAHAASEWPNRFLNSRLARFMLFDRAAGLCQQCTRSLVFDAPPKTWQIDHIIPIFKGGKTALANLQVLCGSCHDKKTSGEKSEARKTRHTRQAGGRWLTHFEKDRLVGELREEIALLRGRVLDLEKAFLGVSSNA